MADMLAEAWGVADAATVAAFVSPTRLTAYDSSVQALRASMLTLDECLSCAELRAMMDDAIKTARAAVDDGGNETAALRVVIRIGEEVLAQHAWHFSTGRYGHHEWEAI